MAEVQGLNVKVGLDSTGFQNGISNLNRQLRVVQSEFQATGAAMRAEGKSFDELRAKSDSLTKQTEIHRQRVATLQQAYQESAEKKGEDSKATQDLEIKLNRAKATLSATEAELRKTNKELELQSSGWYKLGQSCEDVSKRMTDVGKTLSVRVTAPIVALGTAAGKAAIDFESAFAGVKKTVDATDEQLSRLSTGIRRMATEIPASATAIAGVAEAAGQLGIETDNILSFSRVMIDLGESTNLSADQAASSLAQLANITGMNQRDFDKLGSAIVALGNNLATTEADIVNMAMRLAGAGAQVGMTEAQIMAFSGALSSVGIAAEAGGSSFSKLMINMQLAVETGANGLEDFARVAGLSAREFQQAFQEDASGAIIAFIRGLSTAEERGMSAIKMLYDMGITEVRLRDALLRAAGASDVFSNSIELGTRAWNENNALSTEAAQRYETTASKLAILKNQVIEVGIQIGDILLPHITSIVEAIKGWVARFSDLSPGMQEAIVKVAALAAAAGPLLIVGGKLTAGLGNIIGLFGKFQAASAVAATATGALTTATAAGTTATAGLASGLGVAGAAAKASALLLNPWTLGIGAAVGAGVLLYKHLSEETIPTIDLFSSSVSKNTTEVVGSFFEMADGVAQSLNEVNFRGQAITTEMAESITGTYATMTSQIYKALDTHYSESVGQMQAFFANSKGITEAEQAEILAKIEQHHTDQTTSVGEKEARIKQILETASTEKRALTRDEQLEINAIQLEMKETAVRTLSENELEARVILERMKQFAGEMTAKQAAEVVVNSAAQRDGAIAAAEEQYDAVITTIIKQRDEAGTISREQAEVLIREAGRQRDELINKAEETHEMVVSEAKKQADSHISSVDWETGQILSRWERFKQSLSRIFASMPRYDGLNVPGSGSYGGDSGSVSANAAGTDFFGGGWTYVGEEGKELMWLPRGARIFSNLESMSITRPQSEAVGGGISQPSITQHISITSPEATSPSENARQMKRAAQQLALEWW